MIRTTVLAATAALVMSSAAMAESWYVIGSTPNEQSIIYGDADRIVKQPDGSRTAWTFEYYDPLKQPTRNAWEHLVHLTVQCSTQKIMITTAYYYDKLGKVIYIEPSMVYPIDIAPESVGELQAKFICSDEHDPSSHIDTANGTMGEQSEKFFAHNLKKTAEKPTAPYPRLH